jgi:hypothetical protein
MVSPSRSRDPIGLQIFGQTLFFRNVKRFRHKVLIVYFVMVVVLFQVSIETYSGYNSLVAGWGDLTLLTKAPKFLILEPFVDGLCELNRFALLLPRIHSREVAMSVQLFYVWRIWLFKRTILAKVFCVVIVSVMKLIYMTYTTFLLIYPDSQLTIIETVGAIAIPAIVSRLLFKLDLGYLSQTSQFFSIDVTNKLAETTRVYNLVRAFRFPVI